MPDRNMTTNKRWGTFQTREGMLLEVPPSDLFDLGSLPQKIDPFVDSTTQQFPLGTILKYKGRVMRYAKNGGVALTVGKLCQQVVPLAGHIDEAIDEPLVGATVIAFTPNTVTTDDLALNELGDGWIHINDDTGEGYLYAIKSHPAITGGTSGNLTLYDPIIVQPGANATATVLHNPLRNVIVHPSPPTAGVVGVTVSAVAANRYGWLQYQGLCPVLADGTLVIMQTVMASDAVDGAVEAVKYTGTTPTITEVSNPVGICMVVNADTEYALIQLHMPSI